MINNHASYLHFIMGRYLLRKALIRPTLQEKQLMLCLDLLITDYEKIAFGN